MTKKPPRNNFRMRIGQSVVAILCVLALAPGDTAVYAQPASIQDASADQAAPPIPAGQLDSLVAPIALYPDPLLSQVLVASTYPLELIQLQQWLQKNPGLAGDALTAAVQKQDWDASIQAMSVFPDLVKRLTDDIKWTTDLGNAFLAQQSDVMDAVQRMRTKALDAGKLKTNEQMKVETQTVESKTVVVIQPANPQIVYVPTYNPVVVYGPPVYMYPYPPIYYPPPSYYAAGVWFAFGVGIAVGSYYHGGWGYNCGWGRHTTIIVNRNNNYIRHYNSVNINRVNVNNRPTTLPANAGNNWQHNAQHRGGTPYSNQAVAKQYGGTARGDSMSTRQANARQQQGAGNRPQAGAVNQGGAAGNRGGANTGSAAANRPGTSAGAGAGNAGANRSASGNNIGNRQVPKTDASKNTSAFGGSSSRATAQASSTRGASSLGASRPTGGAARSGGGGRPR